MHGVNVLTTNFSLHNIDVFSIFEYNIAVEQLIVLWICLMRT